MCVCLVCVCACVCECVLIRCYIIVFRLWDIRSSRVPLFTITAHEGKVLCLDWSLPQVIVIFKLCHLITGIRVILAQEGAARQQIRRVTGKDDCHEVTV